MNRPMSTTTTLKRGKKLLSWLLALCLCIGLLPTTVWADEANTPISEIKFSIDEPKAGETPAQTAESLTDGIEVDDVRWMKMLDGQEYNLSDDETFENGTTYLLMIDAVVEWPYPVSGDAVAKINELPVFFNYSIYFDDEIKCSTFGNGEYKIPSDFEDDYDFNVWIFFTITDQQQEQTYSVTVTTDGQGDAFASSPSGKQNENIDLTYKAADGWHFKQWILTSGTDAKLQGNTLTIGTSDVTVTAEFEQDKPKTYNVTTKVIGEGSANANPSSGKAGDEIQLSCTPADGWHFKQWILTSGTDAKLQGNTLTIGTSDVTVTAEFEQDKPKIYNVTTKVIGEGSAKANPSSGETGDEIQLSYIPADGWHFKQWILTSGTDAKLQGNTLTIGTSDVTVTAEFEQDKPKTYNVTTKVIGEGSANATPSSGETGDEIQLSCTPADGWHFKGWSLSGGSDAVLDHDNNTLTIGTSDVTVTAEFEQDPEPEPTYYSVTVETVGQGKASASPSSGKSGDEIQLSCTPTDGWHFKQWILTSGTDAKLNGDILTIGTSDVTVTAEFEQDPEPEPTYYSVTVETIGQGKASASPTSGKSGDEITLSCTPADGWHFKGWSLPNGSDAKLDGNTLTIGTSDVTVTAKFEQDPQPEPTYSVEVQTIGQGEAHASPESGKKGDKITLHATAAEGWAFKQWNLLTLNGASLTDNILTLGDGGVVVQAEFKQIETPTPTYSVVIETDGHGSVTPSADSGKQGEQITLTVTPHEGWRLNALYILHGTDATLSDNILTIGTSNVNVRAEFAEITPPEPTYTVTVETSGHGTASASANSGKQGETLTLTAAADEGYQLKGWTLVQANGAVLSDNRLTIGTGNVIVRADFEPLPPPEPVYTVTVETDGHGTGAPSAPSGKYGDTVTLKAVPDPGWRLKAWHIVQGRDAFVTDNVLTIGTENVIVRAEFEPGTPEYTCRWNANGGSWASGATTRTGLTLPSPAPTRSGWTFSGWYTAADGGDRLEDTPYYRSGQIDGLDDDIILYAHWTQNAPAPSGGGGGGGGGGSSAPASSPANSGIDAAASSARFSAVLSAGEQTVGRIRPRGLLALTPASAMPRTAIRFLRFLALLPGGAS